MYQARAKTICEHTTFRKRISHLLAGRFTDRAESIHIEEQLYCGFPSNSDQTHMHSFHRHDWDNRIGVIKDIEDKRYRQFGRRIIATERPDLLTAEQRLRWKSWCRDRLLCNEDVPWLTVPSALEEISRLEKDADPDRRYQLSELECFIKRMEH
jgi:exodeoxyribonuclease-1